MKYTLVAVLLVIVASSCAKKEKKADGPCFQVKQVARLCGDIVLQVQDEQFYYLGEDNWPNPQDENRLYNHVFIVRNYGWFDESARLAALPGNFDDTKNFRVQLTEKTEMPAGACYCLAILPGRPQTEQMVAVTNNCE
jgi:hypothetical protein